MLSVYLLQMLSFIHLHGEYFRSSAHSTRVCVSRCLNIYSSATIGPHRFHASPLPDNSRWGDIRIWHVSPCASVWIWHLRLFILHVFEMKLDVLAWWWLVWHDAESWRKVFFCMFLTAGLSWVGLKESLAWKAVTHILAFHFYFPKEVIFGHLRPIFMYLKFFIHLHHLLEDMFGSFLGT